MYGDIKNIFGEKLTVQIISDLLPDFMVINKS